MVFRSVAQLRGRKAARGDVNRDAVHHDRGARDHGSCRGRRSLRLIVTLAVVGIAMVPAARAKASTPPATSVLPIGAALESGQSLVSREHHYRLIMQRDGDLALYHGGIRVWSAGTEGHLGAYVRLAADGLLAVHAGRSLLWETPAYASHDSARYLVLKDNGNVVLCNHRGTVLWSINRPPTLEFGDEGADVLALQRRLSALGYWLGPPDGQFQDSTQQAVWALQKAANQSTSGVVGPATWSALDRGVVPVPRPATGTLIEVNLSTDLLLILHHGRLWVTLNTSTGGGYTYWSDGVMAVAITPEGRFSIFAEIDGIDVDPLGTLWRPKFFDGGFAIHGDSYVPPFPVSHGCIRVSDEAIDWIWAANVAPIGTPVWVY